MTAPPLPPSLPPPTPAPAPPPLPPGPLAGPPLPPGGAPPLVGGALSPASVARQQAQVAGQAAYLAAKRAASSVLEGPAVPDAGAALPPPAFPPAPAGAPPLATGMGGTPRLAPPVVPPPGMGSAPLPTPAAPQSPPAMAEGGMVGRTKPGPPGVDLLPGVIPAEVILAAFWDRFSGGGGRQMQRFAEGGMVSPELLALLQGAGHGNGVAAAPGGVAAGAGPGLGGMESDALTPDEEAEVEAANAGPPAPKAFVTWVKNGVALQSDDPFDREVYEAAMADPARMGAVFRIARDFLKTDPSQGSPALKQALGLPTGEPSLAATITAEREERMARR